MKQNCDVQYGQQYAIKMSLTPDAARSESQRSADELGKQIEPMGDAEAKDFEKKVYTVIPYIISRIWIRFLQFFKISLFFLWTRSLAIDRL